MYPLTGSMYGEKHRMKELGFVVIAATMIKSSLFFKVLTAYLFQLSQKIKPQIYF
jgi:hypothetical protein